MTSPTVDGIMDRLTSEIIDNTETRRRERVVVSKESPIAFDGSGNVVGWNGRVIEYITMEAVCQIGSRCPHIDSMSPWGAYPPIPKSAIKALEECGAIEAHEKHMDALHEGGA